MSNKKGKVTDKDLYEFLGILSSATEKEIRSAYRKKALQCHPDKNLNDPNATELFRELSEAFEVLICSTAKTAYDQVLKGRAAAKLRTNELDTKRRKLKEDLERREKAATEGAKKKDDIPDELKLQREIERLRKEGSQTLLQEQESIRQEIINQQTLRQGSIFVTGEDLIEYPRIRIKWKKPVTFDEKALMTICRLHGPVNTIVVVNKSALVEFAKQLDAESFFLAESSNSDFQSMKWMCKGKPDLSYKADSPYSQGSPKSPVVVNPNLIPPTQTFEDFEAMVLKNLATAAETQKKTSSLAATVGSSE